jgi:hypothetical protein
MYHYSITNKEIKMSYQNWACYGWMLPATLENAKKLGISDEELKEKLRINDDENLSDIWDDIIDEMSCENIELFGKIGDKKFSVYLQYISGDDEIDDTMDANITNYFAFDFSELYTPTVLHHDLEKLGMKHCSWVVGG